MKNSYEVKQIRIPQLKSWNENKVYALGRPVGERVNPAKQETSVLKSSPPFQKVVSGVTARNTTYSLLWIGMSNETYPLSLDQSLLKSRSIINEVKNALSRTASALISLIF